MFTPPTRDLRHQPDLISHPGEVRKQFRLSERQGTSANDNGTLHNTSFVVVELAANEPATVLLGVSDHDAIGRVG